MKKFFIVLILGVALLGMTACEFGEGATVDKTQGDKDYTALVATAAKNARKFGDNFYVLDLPTQGFAPYADQGRLVAEVMMAFEKETGLEVIAFYPFHNYDTLRTYQIVIKAVANRKES